MPRVVLASLAVMLGGGLAVAGVSAFGDGLLDWTSRTFDPLLRWFEDAPECDGEHDSHVGVICHVETPCGWANYLAFDASSPQPRREIVELSPDPEESVLLVIHGEPRRLSTLALVPGAAPAVVVTRAELPHLAHIENLTCQVRSDGNAWFAMGFDCPDHTVFLDTDRDGVIDRWDQMSEETYYRRYNRWDPEALPPYARRLGEASGTAPR